jgi:hypothetical protein
MNYFAHGRHYVDVPYVLAGTAVPDWLSVVDRRVRARARLARGYLHDPDPLVAQVARGIVLHHRDDAWFHQTRAFAELSLELTSEVRRRLPDDHGFRPSFLGHILVEILLDAALVEQHEQALDDYYQALRSVDPQVVSEAVQRMTTGRTDRLPEIIELFCRERFLYDYVDDARLLARLNRVMRRVRLPELPLDMLTMLSAARQPVRHRLAELLDGTPVSEFMEKC